MQIDGDQASIQEIHRFEFDVNGALPVPAVANGVEASGPVPDIAGPAAQLKAVLEAIKTPWTSSILIIPPQDYLSLNLDLPFASNRDIERVVDAEVQDLLPFDLESFLLHYRALGQRPAKGHDIHVGLLPRATVQRTLQACKSAGFEPFMVSTPAGVLEAAAVLNKGAIPADSAIIFSRERFLCVVALVDGRARVDRVIDTSLMSKVGTTEIGREIRLTLSLVQQRYGKSVSKVLWLGSQVPEGLQEALDIPVGTLPAPELVKAADDSTAIACLASVFAQDAAPPPILTNFRVREFAYSPQLRELARGLRSLSPYVLGTLLVGLLTAIGVYTLREHHLTKLQSAIRSEVTRALPDLDIPPGAELDALEGANRKLEQELANLGSLSSLTPLDYLAEIAADLPLSAGIAVTRVKIDGNKMRVDGTAPDYAAMEKIERQLKRKKNVYCRVRKETNASVAGKPNLRGFNLDILLCE